MEWAGLVDLSKFTVAAAAYGGPIGNSLLIYVITIAVCVAVHPGVTGWLNG